MKLTWLVLVACPGLCAQEASKLTARELFYREDAAPAPKPKPKPVKPVKPVPVGNTTPTGVPVVPAAATNLGVRYNVLQIVDREAKKRKPVDPDKSFRSGDCVAIELASNRNGFLYVFNRGTTGAWQPLLPSPQMPDERNRISNGKAAMIPTEHCFEFDGNAGTERLLVVITEKEEDARRLSDAMKESGGKTPAPSGQTMLAGGKLMHELEQICAGQMIGRDIRIAKIGAEPAEQSDAPNAVYAVKTSTSANDRLVLEIALHHE